MLFSPGQSALTALALVQQIDTTVPAQQGQRLVVDGYAGEIDIKTWGRNAVRVEADPSSRTSVEVVELGRLRHRAHRRAARAAVLGGPPHHACRSGWRLDLSGVYTDVTVVGDPGARSRWRRSRARWT